MPLKGEQLNISFFKKSPLGDLGVKELFGVDTILALKITCFAFLKGFKSNFT
jgi:hypothetical protein